MQTHGGEANDFSIIISMHQYSTLSPYLYTLDLVVLTEHIQELVMKHVLFAYDIVLLGELEENFKTLRQSLESYGVFISRRI